MSKKSHFEMFYRQFKFKGILLSWLVTFFLFLTIGLRTHALVFNADPIFDARFTSIVPPTAVPEVSNESIELAMALYSIELPKNVDMPQIDWKLKDRGATIRSLLSTKSVVRIGTEAFRSWPILASTLAHEIEVHCRQDYSAIFLMDTLGLQGSLRAEVQAYNHELANATRFGLSSDEISSIYSTRNEYYFDGRRNSPTMAIGYETLSASIFTAFLSE